MAGGAPGSARGATGPGPIPVPGSECPAPPLPYSQSLGWPPHPSPPDGASGWASAGALTGAEQGAAAEHMDKGLPPGGSPDRDLGARGQHLNGTSTFLKLSQVDFQPLPALGDISRN